VLYFCYCILHFAACFQLFRGSRRDIAKVSVEGYSSPTKVESCSENSGGKVAAVNSLDKDASSGMGRAFSRICLFACLSVCMFVFHAVKGKWLELSTPNVVHIYSIAVAPHSLTLRSKGKRSRSRVSSALGVGTHVSSTACVF